MEAQATVAVVTPCLAMRVQYLPGVTEFKRRANSAAKEPTALGIVLIQMGIDRKHATSAIAMSLPCKFLVPDLWLNAVC